MSLSHYIDKQIIDKNRNIYFKHYRWILHVLLMLLLTIIGMAESTDDFRNLDIKHMLIAMLPLIPFYIFFYYYCLYLLPYCFKLQRHKRFWIQLITLILIFPCISFYIQWNIKGDFPSLTKDLTKNNISINLLNAYISFLSSFVCFTALFYFFELLEEIRTVKETAQHKHEHNTAALNKIKTQINPAFMSASLNGIIHLAETNNDHAAEAVIQFSDVLRYRLYKSKNKLVAIEQEITQLQNLFNLQHNLSVQGCNCNLEIEGSIHDGRIVPLSLITLVEPLFNLKEITIDTSLLMYLLIEENDIQVAIELNTSPSAFIDLQFEKIKKDLEQLTYEGVNFTLEKDPNNYSLRTCIPTFKNSIA